MMPLDGNWVELIERGEEPGEPFMFAGGPWHFISTDPVWLCVTDYLWAGDRFAVYDWGHRMGETSEIAVSSVYEASPDVAFEDGLFSHRCWKLGPGIHSISIKSLQLAPFWEDATVAFKAVRVDKPVEVPEGGAGAALLVLGLASVAGLSRFAGGARGGSRGPTLACQPAAL